MFRTTAARSIPRSLSSYNAAAARFALTRNVLKAPLTSSARIGRTAKPLSLTIRKPLATSIVRYASAKTTAVIDTKAEAEYAKEKLVPTVELVSTRSSVHSLSGELGAPAEEPDVDMMAGIRNDFKTIKETFSLHDVPKEALYVGMAGVLPYLATSLSTVFLSWDIQHAAVHGEGVVFTGETAEQLLHIIEPIQLGYGATIISFLGAIHWGMEWAGLGGHQGYPRYAIGIFATAVAWPTLLLPAEVGLITQFLAFTFLYYADARASVRGWAPAWYSMYRFVLTFIVGASIVASLIGRGQIADLVTKPPGPADRLRALRESQMEQLEKEVVEESGEEDEEEEEEE